MRKNTEQTEKHGTDGSRVWMRAVYVCPVFFRLFRILAFPLLICSGFLSDVSSKTGRNLGWATQSSGVLSKLSAVFFVDRDRGWVVGSNGTLLLTEDGGLNWRRRTLPERQKNEALNDVWFFNSDRGLLLGEYGIFNRKSGFDWSERIFLLISGDRGSNWETGALARMPLRQTAGQPESVSGRNQKEGADVLMPGRRPSDPILLRMAFMKDQIGWAVGEGGTVQRTDDGGATWKIQETPERKLLYDVAAIDGEHALAVGAGGTILRTVDGGRTWNQQSSDVIQTLRAVHFIDARRGWAVGSKGTVLTTADGGVRWRPQSSNVTLNLNDVFFVNAQHGWIASDRGLLLGTTDGGLTWENVELNTHANLARLFFVAPDCGWVVGNSGAIYKYGLITNQQN